MGYNDLFEYDAAGALVGRAEQVRRICDFLAATDRGGALLPRLTQLGGDPWRPHTVTGGVHRHEGPGNRDLSSFTRTEGTMAGPTWAKAGAGRFQSLRCVSDLEKHRRAVDMTVQRGAIAQVSGGHSTDADGARLATLWRSAAGCVLNVHRGRIAGNDGPASRAVSSGLRLQVPFCRMAGGTWVSHAQLVSADRPGPFR